MMKKILITLMLCICMLVIPSMGAQAAEADIITNDENGIPDETLYKEILKALGKKAGETFTKQEAESLTELDVRTSVKTLKGIGNLSQLESLCIMSQYHLKSLKGIENLHKLVSLDVSYNKIKSLKPVRNLTNLEYLTVDFNRLTSLEGVENLKNLKGLSAGWNKITSLKPLKGLTNLESVWMDHNNLKSLNGIQNAKNMNQLRVTDNNLTSVTALKKLKNLEQLYLGYNKIKKLPNMKNFKKLRYYYCTLSHNRLSEKEIRKKLPDRFLKKGKAKKEWLENQIDYQNLNAEVTLLEPKSTKKISKNTTRIVGRTMKNAYVELYCPTKDESSKRVKADKNGKFVLDGLDLREFAGRNVQFWIVFRTKSGESKGTLSYNEFLVSK